ncbi:MULTISPECIES: 16S rRNA (guanine(527)-N(7))-methyltransferase RsmG [unclassified Paenibacillus]|uniref:16S rRNA (guanine(527)-N(7))-methyltransferase RsmG n=1 Tax=unclassified Paenibacillus TaxID=185978 RepID=UPI00104E8290|nr:MULTISPECIES: 16S rRNA (guanine(527)-N(7))-methyltransferase RsmG [unclassified Paenibacillus]NIK71476.1 16S rRNA (guanine527-N7)-methyltransferase [Paenibacillus sp. BK720]TCM96807.1 16S rRNA m(7)G-527 methyltransferase [Paenibacillus sp. BK033]
MTETHVWFEKLLGENGIPLSPKQLEQFDSYHRLLVEWNEKMNLTGITERDAVFEKHFYDSISLSFFVDMKEIGSIADIGSGAGFPSIPLKICFPHLKVVIVDSLNKRIQFLNHLVQELGLDNVNCVHGRAEDIARMPEYRDAFDLVTARAVARLNVLNEFCLPFTRKNGTFAAMKGSQSVEEVKEAAVSLRELKGKVHAEHAFKLPFEQSERYIVLINKTDATPKKYPRKAGTPLKQPLV